MPTPKDQLTAERVSQPAGVFQNLVGVSDWQWGGRDQAPLQREVGEAQGHRPTWMRASTLSCTMVGGLFLGEMTLTRTLSMKSRLATSTWKRWPQFFTHVSST